MGIDIDLTEDEENLALKLSDAGMDPDYARKWVKEILVSRIKSSLKNASKFMHRKVKNFPDQDGQFGQGYENAAVDLDLIVEGVIPLDPEALMIRDLRGHQIEDAHVIAHVLVERGWIRI